MKRTKQESKQGNCMAVKHKIGELIPTTTKVMGRPTRYQDS